VPQLSHADRCLVRLRSQILTKSETRRPTEAFLRSLGRPFQQLGPGQRGCFTVCAAVLNHCFSTRCRRPNRRANSTAKKSVAKPTFHVQAIPTRAGKVSSWSREIATGVKHHDRYDHQQLGISDNSRPSTTNASTGECHQQQNEPESVDPKTMITRGNNQNVAQSPRPGPLVGDSDSSKNEQGLVRNAPDKLARLDHGRKRGGQQIIGAGSVPEPASSPRRTWSNGSTSDHRCAGVCETAFRQSSSQRAKYPRRSVVQCLQVM